MKNLYYFIFTFFLLISCFVLSAQIEPTSSGVTANFINPTVSGNCSNGSIDIDVTLGTPPFEIIWTVLTDQGNTYVIYGELNLDDQGPGMYDLEINDANCKTATLSIVLSCGCDCELVTQIIEPSCNGFGWAFPKLYCGGEESEIENVYSSQGNTESISIKEVGDLDILVYGVNGCTVNETYEVTANGILDVNYEYVEPSSCSSCDGYLRIVAEPYFENLEIEIMNSIGESIDYEVSSFVPNTIILDDLCHDTYTLQIEGNNCSYEEIIDVCCCDSGDCYNTIEPTIEIVKIPSTQVSSDGILLLTDVPGYFDVSWTDVNGIQVSNNIIAKDLSVGTYCYHVDLGCEVRSDCITLESCNSIENALSYLDYTIIHTCGNEPNGGIEIHDVGVNITWHNGTTGESLSGLYPGTYFFILSNFKGCENIVGEFIVEDIFDSEILFTSTLQPSCRHQFTGQLSVSFDEDFVEEYYWLDDESISTLNRTNLEGGSYGLYIDDGCNTPFVEWFYVPFFSEDVNTAIEYNSDCTRNILLDITTLTGGYTVRWSDGSTNDNVYNQNIDESISYEILFDNGSCLWEDLFNEEVVEIVDVDIQNTCPFLDNGTASIQLSNNLSCDLQIDDFYLQRDDCPDCTSIAPYSVGSNNVAFQSLAIGPYYFYGTTCCGDEFFYEFEINELNPAVEGTFVGFEKYGTSRYDYKCKYIVDDCGIGFTDTTDPIYTYTDWGDNSCCGSHVIVCADENNNEVKKSVSIQPVTIRKQQAYSMATAIDNCDLRDECPPDWFSDYVDDLDSEDEQVWGQRCEHVRVCPNNVCCDEFIYTQIDWVIFDSLLDLFLGAGTEYWDNGCLVLECGDDEVRTCDTCVEVIPQGLDEALSNCVFEIQPPTPSEQNCDDDDPDDDGWGDPNITTSCTVDLDCENMIIPYAYFEESLNIEYEIVESEHFTYESNLYQKILELDGLIEQPWCVDIHYCFCPYAEDDEDKFIYTGISGEQYAECPTDGQGDYICPNCGPGIYGYTGICGGETVEIVSAYCASSDKCEDNTVSYPNEIFDGSVLEMGYPLPCGNFTEEDDPQFNCKYPSFTRFIPVEINGVMFYNNMAAIDVNQQTHNYSYTGIDIDNVKNTNNEFMISYPDKNDYFYINRPIVDKSSPNEYILNFENNDTDWFVKKLEATSSVKLKEIESKTDSVVILNGSYSGSLYFNNDRIGNDNSIGSFRLELNTYSGLLERSDVFNSENVNSFTGGYYYTQLPNSQLFGSSREGDAVVFFDDGSDLVINAQSNGVVEIVDIDKSTAGFDILYQEKISETNYVISIQSTAKDDFERIRLANGNLTASSFTKAENQYYFGFNLKGQSTIFGNDYDIRYGQEIVIVAFNPYQGQPIIKRYLGYGFVEVKQLEHNGYFLYVGGDYAIDHGNFVIGKTVYSRPVNCKKRPYISIIESFTQEDASVNTREQFQNLAAPNPVSHNIELRPNPTTGDLYIEFRDQIGVQNINVRIYNLQGTLEQELLSLDLSAPISMDHLIDGMYLVHIIVDGNSTIKKIIKN